jgi:putative nucleotidyltransferase with HDIG domain
MGFMCLGDVLSVDVAHLDLAGRTLNQIAVAFSNIRLLRELHEFNWGTLEALARAVDEKSSWTHGHSNRVAALAIELAEQMGWSDAELDLLHRAALLHDLGKIGIPLEILDKPDRLNDEEFAVIRTHPDRGAKILEPVRAYAPVIPMVRHHHERYDGSGYPDGLAGTTIPLGARILAVADVYDAVSVTRPYREAWSHAEVCAYLRENAGTLFDPEVVAAFMVLWKPVGED